MNTRADKKLMAELFPLGDNDPRHGTENGYVNWYCRCTVCRQAHTDTRQAHAEEMRKTARSIGILVNDPRHGTIWFYTQYHCRCDACKQAKYNSRRR